MRHPLLAMVVALVSLASQARDVPPEGIDLAPELPKGPFDAVVLAVRHDTLASLGEARLRELLVRDGLLYDIKEVLPVPSSDARI